jgi:hypothetical protein
MILSAVWDESTGLYYEPKAPMSLMRGWGGLMSQADVLSLLYYYYLE